MFICLEASWSYVDLHLLIFAFKETGCDSYLLLYYSLFLGQRALTRLGAVEGVRRCGL